jgi:Rrf2 family protein
VKLSEGVEAAIHSTAMLAAIEHGATMPASALAEAFGLSPSYLLKHLQALTAARILESVPGPTGGYRLARVPEKISLLDIVLAVDGARPAFRCGEIRRNGPAKIDASAYVQPCGINAAMLRAERAYRTALAAEKLSDIIAEFMADADPRVVQTACAFAVNHARPQKTAQNRNQ